MLSDALDIDLIPKKQIDFEVKQKGIDPDNKKLQNLV